MIPHLMMTSVGDSTGYCNNLNNIINVHTCALLTGIISSLLVAILPCRNCFYIRQAYGYSLTFDIPTPIVRGDGDMVPVGGTVVFLQMNMAMCKICPEIGNANCSSCLMNPHSWIALDWCTGTTCSGWVIIKFRAAPLIIIQWKQLPTF